MVFRLWSVAAAAVLGAAGGCSLALDLDEAKPCSSDADCIYSNGDGECVDGTCRPPSGAETSTTDGTDSTTAPTTSSTTPTTSTATTSTTSSSTTDPTLSTTDDGSTTTDDDTTTTGETGDTETVGTTASGLCTRNTDCASDQRCGEEGACIDLLSAECQILQYPDNVDRDTVVYVGSIFPTGGAFTDLVQPLENSVQLAFEDFNDTTTLQGDRQIAWVGCDSTTGSDAAVAGARHLVDNVGVPAIVGPLFSESVLEVANEVTIDEGVFLITPAATSTSITDLEDNNLVWRTIAPDTYQGNGIVDRLSDLTGDATFPLQRLLILAKDDAYGNGLLTLITPELTAALPGVTVYSTTYENPANFASMDAMLASYGATLAGAFTALPSPFVNPEDHYTDVLVLGTSEAQVLLYAYLGTWSTYQVPLPDPSPALPRFTFSHGGVPDMPRYVDDIGVQKGTEALEALKPLLITNLQGTAPVVFDEQNFASFNIRYRIRFNDQDALTSSGLSYDATLSTFFAMCTIDGATDITGAAIAAAMPALGDPDAVDISFSGATLSFITEARNALAVDGNTVNLQGVSGELEWDAAGDIRTGLVGWNLQNLATLPAVDAELDAARAYVLNAEPATDGSWVDL